MVEVIKNNADFKFDWSKQNLRLFGTLRVRHDGMAGTFEKVEVPNGYPVFWPDHTPLIVQVLSIENLENKKRYEFAYVIQDDPFNQIGLVVVADIPSIKEVTVQPKDEDLDSFINEISGDPNKVRIVNLAKKFLTQKRPQSLNSNNQIPPNNLPNQKPESNRNSAPSTFPPDVSVASTKRPQILVEEVSDEILQEIGKRGEEFLYRILLERFPKVTWMNQNGESFAPYDFEVEHIAGQILYIDCKATDYDSPTFFLSLSEWEFVLANSSQYAIYRVFNLRDSPQILVLNDPLKYIMDGDIYPCSFEKRTLNAGTIPLCLSKYLVET